ncbi:DUF302 domain-containing protein [Thioalkalicoccus limnaeus]|uniref:DUF302 domain-containing protein n=1 Tax=Thioalkalicoccus limnaeus TaxID=120681 RepID=A0ABV4B9I1_9GAMM
MKLIRNLFALIGVATLILVIVVSLRLLPKLDEFDPGFVSVYREFASELWRTGEPGAAMMWAVPVEEGLSTDDVIESLKSLAIANDFFFAGEAPFYRQIEAITGETYRYVNFLSFCDALVGRDMLDYRDHYSGFMPCRIALLEDHDGRLWLYSMNLDLMIYGGHPLPDDLKASAIRVRDTILRIMQGAAAGEF